MTTLYHARTVVLGFLFTVLTSNPVWADDIEIFFNSAAKASTQPNLLFVLDASLSMQWFDCANGERSKSDCGDGSLTGSASRLERMNTALKQVLDNSSGVNVSLMRFGGVQGGRVIYPMRDLDAPVCDTPDCLKEKVFSAQGSVRSANDDATEDADGLVSTKSEVVPFMDEDNNLVTGVRFSDLRIPQGAIIEEAKIHLSSKTASTTNDLTFQVEDVADAQPFTDQSQKTITERQWANPEVNWTSNEPWVEEGSYESNDLSTLVSHVVNKPGWCGGNALAIKVEGLGDRSVIAYDDDSVNRMILQVKYKLSDNPNSSDCMARAAEFRTTATKFDGIERKWGSQKGKISDTWANLHVRSAFLTGIQFHDIDIPQGAKIREAFLQFYLRFETTEPTVVNIDIENSINPEPFSSDQFDYSSRTTFEIAKLDLPVTAADTWIRSPDITNTITNYTSAPDWTPGNRMSFIMDIDGPERLTLEGFNGRQRMPTLVIRYEANDEIVVEEINSVRTQMKNTLDEMKLVWGTPTVGAMEEGLRYYSGASVNVGKRRALFYQPGKATAQATSRVSHPESYTGGAVSRGYGCTDDNLNNIACASEQLIGAPVYSTPIQQECQSNHMIVLTDGAPYIGLGRAEHDAYSDVEGIKARTAAMIGKSCEAAGHGVCGVELAEYMSSDNADVNASIPGKQKITTHTIGFNVKNDWIKDVGIAGGGGYHEAASANDLIEVVSAIVQSAINSGSTFVAPAITVDQYSRLSHRKDTYFALFYPSITSNWKGNLKRYDINGSGFVDKDGNEAVDTDTGKFLSTAWSYWSPKVDGNETLQGGAASVLDPDNRNLVTYMGGAEHLLTATSNLISHANKDALLNTDLGGDGEDIMADYIDWLTGYDVKDENKDGDTNDFRHHIGDALHSEPSVVTYAGATAASVDSVVYVGTNEGFLHAFDTTTGEEKFAFMPRDLFANVSVLYDDLPLGKTSPKTYGLDGNITLRMIDNNQNGVVDANDKAYLVVGMRRGGRNYYALDVTDPDKPEFLWEIIGGTGDFKELGQSWSKPTLAKIKVGNEVKNVFVFGGGYDADQDDNKFRQKDDVGRAIFIVDADNGTLIWDGGPSGTGAKATFDDMDYSIPSDLKIIADDKGLLTQIYVGDMGSRLWRFDINNGKSGNELIDGGVIADFGGIDASSTRRFYHPPDLSLTRKHGELKLNIAIGSGYQAHPLNTQIEDKFTLIRYPYRNKKRNYGMYRELTDDYSPITLEDLFDTEDLFDSTGNLISDIDNEQLRNDARTGLGWFITMETTGEKILGSSTTLNNVIKFISYVPTFNASGCEPSMGTSFYWTINLEDGTPHEGTGDPSSTQATKDDRKRQIPGEGIAPPVQTVFVADDNGAVTITDVSGVNKLQEWGNLEMIKRWYWAEQQ